MSERIEAQGMMLNALHAPAHPVTHAPVVVDPPAKAAWAETHERSLTLLVCTQASSIPDQLLAYTRVLSDLLNAPFSSFNLEAGSDFNCDTIARTVEQVGYDLVIWGEPDQTLGQRILCGPAYQRATELINSSLLVVRKPRWPLRRLLLIIQGEKTDEIAVDWIVRLAQPSGARVTVLAVVPSVPAMYYGCTRMQQGLDALLTTDTVLGRQMQRVAQRLVDSQVAATLQLRQGEPDRQIQHEVSEGDYDLVTVAVRSRSRWRRWLLGDWVSPLLSWAVRPVLVAKPWPGVLKE
jgi:nucleotide-binding universal stress UspA family protein